MENEIRIKCFTAIKEMSTVQIEKQKILLNAEADKKMGVISKEYQILSDKIRGEQSIHVEKLDAKN